MNNVNLVKEKLNKVLALVHVFVLLLDFDANSFDSDSD